MRHFARQLALFIVAFMIGFLPMWAMFHERSSRLSAATHELNLARAQGALTSAVVDVQRGDYEPARDAASSFFTSLRAEAGGGAGSPLSPAQVTALQPLLARRDDIITLLARSDPASLAQVSDLYVSYRAIMNP